eukprot:sb/3472367/
MGHGIVTLFERPPPIPVVATVGPRFTGPRFTGTPIYREDFFPPIFFGKFSKFGRLVNLHLQFARSNEDPGSRIGSFRTVSWYRILDKSRIYGLNMLYPDIPGTPIYRAKFKMASPEDPGKSGSDCIRELETGCVMGPGWLKLSFTSLTRFATTTAWSSLALRSKFSI